MLEIAEAPEDHPLMTAHEFDAWRGVILDAYRGECPQHDPVKFITERYVRDFAADSLALIDEIFHEAID